MVLTWDLYNVDKALDQTVNTASTSNRRLQRKAHDDADYESDTPTSADEERDEDLNRTADEEHVDVPGDRAVSDDECPGSQEAEFRSLPSTIKSRMFLPQIVYLLFV